MRDLNTVFFDISEINQNGSMICGVTVAVSTKSSSHMVL